MKRFITICLLMVCTISFNSLIFADNTNCDYPASSSHDQSCKGQLGTCYITQDEGNVVVSFPAPSENVITVTGPYPNPSWYKSNGMIYVTLNAINVDYGTSWMEVIVSDGYYHVEIIKEF